MLAALRFLSPYRAAGYLAARCAAFMHEVPSLWRLAWPLILSQLAQSGILFVDSLLMGQLGPAALAGGALALSTYFLVYVLAFGVLSASGTLVALAYGAGKRRRLVAAVRAGLVLGAGLSLLAGVLLWHAEPWMLMLGQAPETARVAAGFLRVLVWGLPFGLLFLTLRSFASGINRPGPVPFITFSALALSAVLGWLLSQGLGSWRGLGVYGIALSSAITYFYMGMAFTWVVRHHRGFARYPVFGRIRRRDLAMIGPVLRLGLPTAGTLGMESGLFSASAYLMGALGAAQLAAHQSMMQLVIASFIVPMGLMHAISMRVGQAIGAGEPRRARGAALTGQLLALVWTGVTASVLLLMPETLLSAFLPAGRPGAEAARAVALTLAPVAALLFVIDAWQSILGAALRAVKDARFSMVVYGLGCWGVGFPLAWVLSHGPLGALGVWVGLTTGLVSAGLLLMWRFEKLSHALIAGRRQVGL
ncbi:putative efflux protein, MATE family [Gulbenkiania indica]|uniref:Putative efflux protein, MATE family n=1 Tax=Gulbenkiania indica TaxID=375574 RepID=A0A0K6GXI6_9NEIS|nr:MATE family efflux transporter [Gulbenkiania indica]CUA83457.1 putative efflux protein, MATE family [Gulbenkiania indica]